MANGDVSKREFAFKLTDEEIEQRKHRHLAVERDIDAEVNAKGAEMAERNATLKGLRKDRKALIEACTTGSEKREVDVRESWDFQRNRVIFIRVDTGVEIEERAMTGTERQEDMFGDPPDAETGKTPKAKKNGKGKATTDKPTRAKAKGGKLHPVT